MSSSDRNQKLKNYHARKVRERQQQLQFQLNSNENGESDNKPASAKAFLVAVAGDENSISGGKSSSVALAGNMERGGGGAGQRAYLNNDNIVADDIVANKSSISKGNNDSRSSRSLFASHNYPSKAGIVKSDKVGFPAAATAAARSVSSKASSIAAKPSSSLATTAVAPTTSLLPRSTNTNDNNSNNNTSTQDAINNTNMNNNNAIATTTTNTTATTNNASAAARMFAARRRKAQLEMATECNSSISAANRDSVDSSNNNNKNNNSSSGVESSCISSSDGSSSSSGSSTIVSGGASGSTKISVGRGGGGGGGATLASRKAYEICFRSGGSASLSSSSSSGGSSSRSGGQNDHLNDIGSSAQNSVISGSHGTTTTISTTREGLSKSSSGREESSSSFSSMATIRVSNNSRGRKTTMMAETIHAASADDNDTNASPQAHDGILRQPHQHEAKTTTTTTTKCYEEKEDGHSKLVRFHLSPLERQKKKIGSGGGSRHETTSSALASVVTSATRTITDSTPPSSRGADVINLNESFTSHLNGKSSHDKDDVPDEGFAMFVNGLRREVAGDHTKLWSEFQSILGRTPKEHVPLYVSNDDNEANNSSDNDAKKKKKENKTIRMDPQTTTTLNMIYKKFHEEDLLKNKSSSRRYMTNKSQLRNDKDIAKQQREEKRMSPAIEEATSAGEVSRDSRPGQGQKSLFRYHPEEARPKAKSSHQSTYNKFSSSKEESELATFKLRPTSTSTSTNAASDVSFSPFNVKLRRTPTKTPPPTERNEIFTTPTISPSFSVGISGSSSKRSLLKRSSSKSSSSGRSHASSASPKSPKSPKRPNWIEALKKKQMSQRQKQMAELNSASEQGNDERGGGNLATGCIILKQVSPRKKLRISPPSSPEEMEGQVPPWAKLQLRSTPMRDELLAGTSTNSSVEEGSTRSTPMKDELLGGTPTNSSVEEGPTSKTFTLTGATMSTNGTAASSPLPHSCSCCVGDTIDLDSLPKRLFPEEAAAIFRLTSKNAIIDDSEEFVIVGTLVIVTASSNSGSKGRKANITWWCHRSAVRTLTLNVEATGATLSHADGRTHLLFESSDICLDFAQAFYRGPLKQVAPVSSQFLPTTAQKKVPNESTEKNAAAITNAKHNDEAGRININLTQEEESLLDEYRKFAESDKPKLRLTCLSPKGEEVVEVTVPAEHITNAAVSNIGLKKEGGFSLTDEEAESVSKYKKMLAVGIPSDAVRHKMVTEGVQAHVVAAVFEESGTKDENDASDPRQAHVATIIATGNHCDLSSESIASIDAESSKIKLSEGEEVIASKYRRMLKMGIPLEGVQHAMAKEGVDSKIASAVAGDASPEQTVSAFETPAKPNIAPNTGPVLSEEEEKIASKYRKMLKLFIPKDAVRHDMKKEGISDKIVEAVFGKEGTGKAENMQTPATKGKHRKTIALHWTTSNLAPELLERSIFARSTSKKRKLVSINPEEADIKKLEELFQKKINVNSGQLKSGQPNAGNGLAKLLDINRANNIAIQLKAFNDFTLRSLAETINDLDPDNKIVGERVEFIPQLLPTPKELQEIKKYKGGSNRLITAELFFLQLLPVKRIEDKVEVMKTMCTFNEHAEEARAAFKTLEEVCRQVMSSEKLEKVLLMVLNVGNLMNEGTIDGVDAFKFESLPKLSQTKSADGKTTVLDYIAETFIEKGERETLFINSDFPDIQESCRLSINDLCGDLNTLRKSYQLCQKELNCMKEDQVSKPSKSSPKGRNEGKAADPRNALFAAIKALGTSDDDDSSKLTASIGPRQALFAAIKNKGVESSHISSEAAVSNVKYSRGVQRLETFLCQSERVLSLAERDQNAAVRACKGLAVYCGEEGEERSASSLLQILAAFASSLEAAVEKYDRRAEASRQKQDKSKNIPQREKDKENKLNALSTKQHLLKVSSLTDKVKIVNGQDSNFPSSAQAKPRSSPMSRNSMNLSNSDESSRSVSFAGIKSRNEVPVGVPNKVRTINTNVQRRESRVLMVNKMLKDAPAKVKEDFIRGVTYSMTNDPLLQKIYENEGVEEDETPNDLRPVDPRQELFAAIKSRRKG